MSNLMNQIRIGQYRRNFYRFVLDAWRFVEPREYKYGWHIEKMCLALQKLYKGELKYKNLYFNMPPVHAKTLICSVLFPAWVWANDPTKKLLCISYAAGLAEESAIKSRNLIESDWYRELFNVKLSLDQNTVSKYSTTVGGLRYSYGIDSKITGSHSDICIMDDLLKADDAHSDIEMEKVNRIYDESILNRFTNPNTFIKILVCQRLSPKDIIGWINKNKEPYEKIIWPCLSEGKLYSASDSELDDTRNEGEILWPQEYGIEKIVELQNKPVLVWSGQYQQRPSPIGGTIFSRSWFKSRVLNTEVAGRIISVDTSYGNNKKSDYTSIIIGEFDYSFRIFIREVYRGRLEFPQVISKIEEFANKYKYNLKKIIIESKATGISVIQSMNQSSSVIHTLEDELGLETNDLLWGITPTDNKIKRASIVSHWCEKERILLPPPSPEFPWLFDFEEELFNFPRGANDDMVDAFTQLLGYKAVSEYLSEGLFDKN